ncbi:MAG: antitoxin [Sporichthyaceae bacterium]|jgi:hypothetical protein
MSFLKNAQAKAEKLVAGNRDKIDKGLAKAGQLADKKTKGKHHDKIGKGLGAVSKGLDRVGRQNPGAPGSPPRH